MTEPIGIQIESWNNMTVCGAQQAGKTTLEKHLLPMYKCAVIFDPNNEFTEFPLLAGEIKGIRRYIPKTDSPLELEKIAERVWRQGNCILLVSEAELFLPEYKPLPPAVFKLIARGAHRNCGIIADTRRVALLNKSLFALSKHVFIFRHFAPNDIRYLNEFIPRDCRELASLPNFHFWHYSQGKVEIMQPLKLNK